MNGAPAQTRTQQSAQAQTSQPAQTQTPQPAQTRPRAEDTCRTTGAAASAAVSGHSPVLAGKRLGFLLHLDSDRDPAESYREGIALFQHAERLGYDSGWVIQRHFRQGNEHVSAPLTFLAAVAQHTERIRLGTGVVVLPLEDPLRVAEDASTVDHLSGGRLERPGACDRAGAGRRTRRRRAAALPGDRLEPAANAQTRRRASSPRTARRCRRIPPRVPVSRAVYPDVSRADALGKLAGGARRWQEWFAALGREGVDTVTPEEYLVRDHTRFGPAADIAAGLADDPAVAAVPGREAAHRG